MATDSSDEEFSEFVRSVEPRLHRALVAAWGMELGRDAASNALVYAWRHWRKVQRLDNPVGYLYRVGHRSVKRPSGPTPTLTVRAADLEPWIEPELERALMALSLRQRTSVVMHYSFGWTHQEIASILGLSRSTVQNHIERGLRALRTALEVQVDA